MAAGILVFGELHEGKLKKPALEAMGEARRLASKVGGPVTIVCLGRDAGSAAALAVGVVRALLSESTALASYSGEAYAAAFLAAVRETSPAVILIPASSTGKDLAPRVAAALGVACVSDCTALGITDGQIEAVRPVYAGKAIAIVRSRTSPFVATLRPNVFPQLLPDATMRTPEVATLAFEAPPARTRVKSVHAASSARTELTQADVIVSGGRGLKGPENFKMLEELADVLGAAVGASRAVVDAGWRPHSDQVGQTGKTVSPNLYIACGISGAIQHLAGMSSSKVIVAINKDAEAPIFQVANYGIVGDVFEVVPALTEELRRRRRD